MQTEKVIEYITKWIKDYQQSSHTKDFFVGVSGDVDSGVVSTLCARTGLPTLLFWKCQFKYHPCNEIRRSHAHTKWLIKNFLNTSGGEVNLTEVFERTVKKK